MATIKLGAFVKSIRGKAGNTAFAETKLGTVARDVTRPTGEPSEAQVEVRLNMKRDGAAWQALSVESAANWRAAASRLVWKAKKSGKPFVPNGYQLFTAYTTKWLQIHGAGAAPSEPPTGEFAGDSITLTAAVVAGGVQWTASGANASGVSTELLFQPIKGKHRKAGADGYVSRSFHAFTGAGGTWSTNMPAGYWAAGYRFVEPASGRETAIVPLGILTVALSVEIGGSEAVARPARAKKAA